VLAEDGGVEELAIRLGGSLHPPILLDLSRNRESCRIAQRSPRACREYLCSALDDWRIGQSAQQQPGVRGPYEPFAHPQPAEAP
jgi:hypothetical protein